MGRLKNQIVSGFFWSAAEKFASLLVYTCVGFILMRLLEPSHFGVLSMLTIFSAVANVIVDSGFSQALIQKQRATQTDYNSVFYLNVVLAVALYLLMWGLAYPISRFYETPILTQIAPWLFCVLPINAFATIQMTILTKSMDFKSLSKSNFIASLTAGVVAVVMAVRGYGVWALVAQMLTVHSVRMVLLWVQSSWRPKAEFSVPSIKGLWGFGSRLFATGLITQIYSNMSQFLIGRFYSPAQLGLYSQSMKLKDSMAGTITMSVQNVTFPAFATLQDDDRKLSGAFAKVVTVLSFLLFPVMLGLISVAQEGFFIVGGEKWVAAVPFFKIFALSALCMPLINISLNILKAKGAGKTILKLELIKKSVSIVVIICAATVSMMALAWAYFACVVFDMVVNVIFVRKIINYHIIKDLRHTTLPYLAMAAVMYCCVVATGQLLDGAAIGVILCAKIFVGVATYTLMAWIFKPRAWGEVVQIMRQIRSRP